MEHSNMTPTLAELSPITEALRKVFGWAKWLGPVQWLGLIDRTFKPRSDVTKQEAQSVEFGKKRSRAIELYLAVWWLVELVLVVVSLMQSLPSWLVGILLVLSSLRIIEILQVTVNAALFDALSGRPDERVASRVRLLVLSGINFLELMICFGIIYAVNIPYLHGAGQPITAYYFSIITQLTIGYGDVYPTNWLRIVAAAQGLTGVILVILVFGRFVASLPRISDLSDLNHS